MRLIFNNNNINNNLYNEKCKEKNKNKNINKLIPLSKIIPSKDKENQIIIKVNM